MKNKLIRIYNNIKLFFISLIYGMKNTEDIILHQTGEDSEETKIHNVIQTSSVAKALLKGEVTQEVEELRYRTYKVDEESQTFEYYSPTLALKKDGQNKKDIKYYNDGFELLTSQTNDSLIETIQDGFNQLGKRGERTRYRIKISRGNFIPRYKIEQFITRIDVKKVDEENVVLDAFVSIYPNEEDFKSKGFIKEIEYIKDEKRGTDIFDIDEIEFITKHAYLIKDNVKFRFTNVKFMEIISFDGHYILRFKAKIYTDIIDYTKIYYSKTMDEKYKNKVRKDVVLSLSDYLVREKFVCEDCGKEVYLDQKMIDELNVYQGRDITTEEVKTDNINVLEFLDMQISNETFGKMMCSECLRKYLKNNNLI